MCPSYSQADKTFRFSHIGLSEGLSQSTVVDITQDKYGNMWFATYNGLNKYNGYEFAVYKHDESDSCSIAGDVVRIVIWIKPEIYGQVQIMGYRCMM